MESRERERANPIHPTLSMMQRNGVCVGCVGCVCDDEKKK